MANQYMKTCSPSSFMREIQIKTIGRNYFTTTRMAKIKKNATIPNVHEDVELQLIDEREKWYNHLTKLSGGFL